MLPIMPYSFVASFLGKQKVLPMHYLINPQGSHEVACSQGMLLPISPFPVSVHFQMGKFKSSVKIEATLPKSIMRDFPDAI